MVMFVVIVVIVMFVWIVVLIGLIELIELFESSLQPLTLRFALCSMLYALITRNPQPVTLNP